MLTAARLRELVRYDAETGRFVSIATRHGGASQGKPLGTINRLGYVVLRLEKRLYLGHRLAWLYVTGEWPSGNLDHKNADRADNRWDNLRPATQQENLRNTRKRSDNTSGFKGVRYRANRGHWYATIKVDSQTKYLGAFPDAEGAHAAYANAAALYFGQFARAE